MVWELVRCLLYEKSKYITDFMADLIGMNRKNSFHLIVKCILRKKEYFLFPILLKVEIPLLKQAAASPRIYVKVR